VGYRSITPKTPQPGRVYFTRDASNGFRSVDFLLKLQTRGVCEMYTQNIILEMIE